MPVSDSKRRANAKHDKANYNYQSIKYKKSDRLIDMVRYAVSIGKGKSVNDYMIQAIKTQLSTDGITMNDFEQEQDE